MSESMNADMSDTSQLEHAIELVADAASVQRATVMVGEREIPPLAIAISPRPLPGRSYQQSRLFLSRYLLA